MRKRIKSVAQAEVKSARQWLRARKIEPSEIPPVLFAKGAKELGVSFSELLRTLAQEQTGGQV